MTLPGLSRAVDFRDRTMLALMYWCGLRVDEVGGLAVEDVVWVEEREAWELVVRRAKSSWEDVVLPIEDATGKLLSSYRLGVREGLPGDVALFPSLRPGRKKDRGRGLKPDAVRKIFEARRKAAGIRLRGRVLTPHCLRHTLATELVNTPGWELDDVQAHMRHASMDTTRGYVHRSEGRRAQLLRRCHPWVRPRGGASGAARVASAWGALGAEVKR